MWAIVNLRLVKDVCTNDHVRYVHIYIYIHLIVYIMCVYNVYMIIYIYICV